MPYILPRALKEAIKKSYNKDDPLLKHKNQIIIMLEQIIDKFDNEIACLKGLKEFRLYSDNGGARLNIGSMSKEQLTHYFIQLDQDLRRTFNLASKNFFISRNFSIDDPYRKLLQYHFTEYLKLKLHEFNETKDTFKRASLFTTFINTYENNK